MIGPVEQETAEGVPNAGAAGNLWRAGGAQHHQLRYRFVEGVAPAWIEGLVLQQLIAVAAVVHAELDGVIAQRLGGIHHEVEVRLPTLPRQAGRIAHHRIGEAVDVERTDAAGEVRYVHALDADLLGGLQVPIGVGGVVAEVEDAGAHFGHDRRRPDARVIDGAAVALLNARARKVAESATLHAIKRRIEDLRALQ